MRRLLLDTNIYGLIVVDPERKEVHSVIHSKKDIHLYGFEIVRKELRSTKRTANINLRIDLLRVYDDLVDRSYELTVEMKKLADQYYELYSQIGGTQSKDKMLNDFLIIACASLKNLDLVVSNDLRTMLSDWAIKAYIAVNRINNIKLPKHINYEEFKNVIQK
ncbi:MAG: hypothetical protein KKH52_00110 [Nanoarchaeota archaeon]|nr:hypothetical protein [Nanoarchaeota archaeon]MBU1973779.1 hypothetical protein [Nanoarchaeota archaeon]